MSEFKIGEIAYRSGKLNAFDQLFIVKRLVGSVKNALTPELITMISDQAAASADAKAKGIDAPVIGDPVKYLEAFAGAISKMPDDDLTYVIGKCCAVTQTYRDGKWFNVVSPSGNYMYQDISAAAYIQIAFNVLSENLGGFFDELPSTLGLGEKQGQKSA